MTSTALFHGVGWHLVKLSKCEIEKPAVIIKTAGLLYNFLNTNSTEYTSVPFYVS
jgi:hypothetical protein